MSGPEAIERLVTLATGDERAGKDAAAAAYAQQLIASVQNGTGDRL